MAKKTASVTPQVFQTACEFDGSCPTLIKKGANYIIVGRVVTPADHSELTGRIGVDEAAVEVPAELLDEVVNLLIELRAKAPTL